LHELGCPFAGIAQLDPSADDDDRPFAPVEGLGDPLDLFRILQPLRRRRRNPLGLICAGGAEDVFRDVDQNRSGASGAGKLEACRSDDASWVTSRTIKLCFVIGMVIPMMSVSWKASRPQRSLSTWAVMATSGVESMQAVAIPVTRFVAPGPDVARQTPTLPVARA